MALQESQKEDVSSIRFENIWGNKNYGMEFVGSVGRSGGLICLWDSGVFDLELSIKRRCLLAVRGKLRGSGERINFLNVYAPQSTSAKLALWNEILVIMGGWNGFWVVAGDFNAVRDESERKNSGFRVACANNFNDFIAQASLLEYDMKGFRFTCSRENGKKLSKLDRILVNPEFFNKWPSASLRALPFLYSDHCPIVLEVGDKNFGPKPFRVFDFWFDKEGFKEAVEQAVSSFCPIGVPDLSLTAKFSHLRKALKVWRDDYLKKEGEEFDSALEELETLESIMEIRELNEEEQWVFAENKKVILERDIKKCSEAKQRARVKWAVDGDANSKYFHSLVNLRKASNSIPGLVINGRWESDPARVKKEIMFYFRSRFKEEWEVRPLISYEGNKTLGEEEKNFLIQTFSLEEIKVAVSECGSDKAPGPDGLNMRFIKKFWHLFEEDFLEVLNAFHANGEFSVGSGSSFITLIPKLKDPVELKNYRPINLIGIISKVVSKVLANRLKKVIGSVVSESQSAFLEGNFILDGPLMVNEIHRWGEKCKKKGFFFKIDFEKAYDNVNWNFLIDSMSKRGFPDRWCHWIKGILKSARSSVLVNGSPTFEFQCFKGLRQGDPISPFLFILVMDVLSSLIDKAKEEGIVKGLKLPNEGPSISHLFYADDAIILGEWSSENISNMVRILRIFHVCSGLKINLDKSSLFGMGVNAEEIGGLASSIGCNAGSFPFSYLGIKVGANMNRVENWREVYNIFDARLSRWKASLLSIGGRVVLIKSVLESLPNYYFSLYKAPCKVISDLEAKVRRFLWGGNESNKKMHWVAWKTVTCPKNKGGLGLYNLRNINVSLLSKWGWRLKVERKKLWVKVVEAIHKTKFNWNFIPFRSSMGGVWCNIAKTIAKTSIEGIPLRAFFRSKIGNGENTAFWLDPWLCDEPLKLKYPELFKLEKEKGCKVVDRLKTREMAGGSGSSYGWDWRKNISDQVEVNELVDLCGRLLHVQLIDSPDSWEWIGAADKAFSVRAVKNLLSCSGQQSNSSQVQIEECKWVPGKVNILMWRAGLNSIATAEALRSRHIDVQEDECVLCKDGVDSVSHIFSSCLIATVVWQHISRWCKVKQLFFFDFKDVAKIHDFVGLSGNKKEAFKGIVRIAVWCLWKARNKARFENKEARIEDIVNEVKALGFLWFSNRSKCKKIEWDHWCKFVFM
ncbi:putative RNA-directed DNA polymerase [Helianthus annuus]|nr:putative RNA-directed DNA polymerase [Helianthus annuus]KAJ0879410.1 putative RNA-directed DNA polymerase [Helianthus annuus]